MDGCAKENLIYVKKQQPFDYDFQVMLSCQRNDDNIPSIMYDINSDNCCNGGLIDYVKVKQQGEMIRFKVVSLNSA